MAYGQNMNAPMSGLMGLAAMKGRQGDNTLVHVNPMELKALNAMAPGGLTTNPTTGLPEAFKLKDLLPILGGIAGGVIGGPLGAAAGSGLGTALAGGNKEEILGSAAVSGLTAGMTGGFGSAATQGAKAGSEFAVGEAAKKTTLEAAGQTFTPAAVSPSFASEGLSKVGMTGVQEAAAQGLTGTAAQTASNVASSQLAKQAVGAGLGAAAMYQPEQKEIQYGPIQEIQTQQTQQASPEDIDKYIRQGGAMPNFFKFNVTQPGVYRAEGGPVSQGEMFSGMVEGNGDGMSDGIPFDVVGDPEINRAMLSPDEYVMDAYTVAALGNGSSDAGAEKLDQFRKELREKVYGNKQQPNQINPNKELSKLS
jgi:hypothetical protein